MTCTSDLPLTGHLLKSFCTCVMIQLDLDAIFRCCQPDCAFSQHVPECVVVELQSALMVLFMQIFLLDETEAKSTFWQGLGNNATITYAEYQLAISEKSL